VLLRFMQAECFYGRWSDEIVAEWHRSVLSRRDIGDSLKRQTDAMQAAFPDAWVEAYRHRIESLTLPDPDDRHVLAAAIETGADAIVTENQKDFPADVVRPHGIVAVRADAFLSVLFDADPVAASQALRVMRQAYRGPPGREDFLDRLSRCGLPTLAKRAEGSVGDL